MKQFKNSPEMRKALSDLFELSLIFPEVARQFPAVSPFVGSIADTIPRKTLNGDYAVWK